MKSTNSAINLLNKVYTGNDADILATADMFVVLGKEASSRKDASFVATQVSLLKRYGLITPNYKYVDGYERRVSITLTRDGKIALGRLSSNAISIEPQDMATVTSQITPIRTITPEEVLTAVKILRDQNPSFKVGLIFEPRDMPIVR